jgi:plastocyanin
MSLRSRRGLSFAAGIGALLPFASTAAAVPRTYTIVIDKMKFGPVPAELHKGDAIIWANRDFLRHSATAADHSFDADLRSGTTARTVLNKSGAIAFVCRYHPGMRGVLRVK